MLSDALAALLGVNAAEVHRGKSINPIEESRTNTAYGTLPNADQVAGVVLPTDGLILVWFKAQWKESVNAAARAAIFLGANQLKNGAGGGAPGVAEVALNAGAANAYNHLTSGSLGLVSGSNSGTVSDVTTGQTIGHITGVGGNLNAGVCAIFAAAGTYTVSVQFKAASGTVSAQNRKLWVEAVSF